MSTAPKEKSQRRSDRHKRTAQGSSKNARFTNKHARRRSGRRGYRGQGR